MPVSPEQLLTAAEALLERGSEEVDWRNAASRAYYASYHRCSVIAESHKLPMEAARGMHVALCEALSNAIPMPLKALGYMLNHSRLARVSADYHLDGSFDRSEAEDVLASSHRIMARADEIE